MDFSHSSVDSNGQQTASPHFDILAGPSKVEAAVEQMAAVRKNMSPVELGTMAGVGVLDWFRVAKAETTIRWWKDPALAISGFYNLLGVGLPALGFVSGIAIDVAIFGGASNALAEVNRYYCALTAGSLVFAVGMGIAPDYRKYFLPLMATACLGASLVASNNPKFKNHFATIFPDTLNSTSNAAYADVRAAQSQVNAINDAIKKDEHQLNTGGIGGLPIFSDSYRGPNRDEGHILLSERKNDEALLRSANEKLAKAQAKQDVADKTNTAQYLGRLMGALYISAWLVASQLVIAKVIEVGDGILQIQKKRSSQDNVKALFVRQLEDPNPEKIANLAAAAVSDMLMRFSRILAVAATGSPEKQENFTRLFEKDSFAEMRQIGTDLVCGTLTPRKNWSQGAANFVRDRFPKRPAATNGKSPAEAVSSGGAQNGAAPSGP